MTTKPLSLEYSQQLKGLAFLGVVTLHIISSLPAVYLHTHTLTPFILILDQISRLCVPLFVAVTGYGLTVKYKNTSPSFFPFFTSRIVKLLPLFFLWSLASIIILRLHPIWNQPISEFPLLVRFFIGQADYHLYYVPMIIQLFFLFPFLSLVFHRFEKTTLLVSLCVQFLLYGYYSLHETVFGLILNDQRQYFFAFSWIFYFVLGMYLAKRKTLLSIGLSLSLAGIGFLGVILPILKSVATTDNLVSLLRFTKPSVIVYATGMLLFFLTTSRRFPFGIGRIFAFLGKNSYLLYLAHPLLFRIWIGYSSQTIDLSILMLALGIYVFTLFVSFRLLKE